MSECRATPAVWDEAGETHFSPAEPRVLWQNLQDWEKGGLGNRQIKISKGVKRILCSRKYTIKPGGALHPGISLLGLQAPPREPEH